jgi:hypothetical protein
VTEYAYATVKTAIDKTRSNAGMQAFGGIALTAGLVSWNRGFPWWIIAFIVLNTWVTFVMGRRWIRLRSHGATALKSPASVTQIRGWPVKVPPERMPLLIEVVTHDGMFALNIDPKKPAEVAKLVRALKERSPNAICTVQNVPLANESSPAA